MKNRILISVVLVILLSTLVISQEAGFFEDIIADNQGQSVPEEYKFLDQPVTAWTFDNVMTLYDQNPSAAKNAIYDNLHQIHSNSNLQAAVKVLVGDSSFTSDAKGKEIKQSLFSDQDEISNAVMLNDVVDVATGYLLEEHDFSYEAGEGQNIESYNRETEEIKINEKKMKMKQYTKKSGVKKVKATKKGVAIVEEAKPAPVKTVPEEKAKDESKELVTPPSFEAEPDEDEAPVEEAPEEQAAKEEVPLEVEPVEETTPVTEVTIESDGELNLNRNVDESGKVVYDVSTSTNDLVEFALPEHSQEVSVNINPENTLTVSGEVSNGFVIWQGQDLEFQNEEEGSLVIENNGDLEGQQSQVSLWDEDNGLRVKAEGNFKKEDEIISATTSKDGEESSLTVTGSYTESGKSFLTLNNQITLHLGKVPSKEDYSLSPENTNGEFWVKQEIDGSSSIMGKGYGRISTEMIDDLGNPVGEDLLGDSINLYGAVYAEENIGGQKSFFGKGFLERESPSDGRTDLLNHPDMAIFQDLSALDQTNFVSLSCPSCTIEDQELYGPVYTSQIDVIGTFQAETYTEKALGQEFVFLPESSTFQATFEFQACGTGGLCLSSGPEQLGELATDLSIQSKRDNVFSYQDGQNEKSNAALIGSQLILEKPATAIQSVIDLDSAEVYGEEIVPVTDSQLIDFLAFAQNFPTEFRGSNTDVALRIKQNGWSDLTTSKLIEDATGIDPKRMLENDDYTGAIISFVRYSNLVEEKQEILSKKGLMFDNAGNCLNDNCQQKLNQLAESSDEENQEAYLAYLELRKNTQKTTSAILKAKEAIAEEEGKDPTSYQEATAKLEEKVVELSQAIAVVEGAYGVVEQISQELAEPSSVTLYQEARQIKNNLETLQQEREIWRTKLDAYRKKYDSAKTYYSDERVEKLIAACDEDCRADSPPSTFWGVALGESDADKGYFLYHAKKGMEEAQQNLKVLTYRENIYQSILSDFNSEVEKVRANNPIVAAQAYSFSGQDELAVATLDTILPEILSPQSQNVLMMGPSPLDLSPSRLLDSRDQQEILARGSVYLAKAGDYEGAVMLVKDLPEDSRKDYVRKSYLYHVAGGKEAASTSVETQNQLVREMYHYHQSKDKDWFEKTLAVGEFFLPSKYVGIIMDGVTPSTYSELYDAVEESFQKGDSGLLLDPEYREFRRKTALLAAKEQGARQTQREIMAGTSRESLTSNVYSTSATFTCSTYGVNCGAVEYEQLIDQAELTGELSLVYSQMYSLAKKGNSQAQEWVDEHAWEVVGKESKRTVMVAAQVADIFLLEAGFAKLSQAAKLRKTMRLGELSESVALGEYGAALNVVKKSPEVRAAFKGSLLKRGFNAVKKTPAILIERSNVKKLIPSSVAKSGTTVTEGGIAFAESGTTAVESSKPFITKLSEFLKTPLRITKEGRAAAREQAKLKATARSFAKLNEESILASQKLEILNGLKTPVKAGEEAARLELISALGVTETTLPAAIVEAEKTVVSLAQSITVAESAIAKLSQPKIPEKFNVDFSSLHYEKLGLERGATFDEAKLAYKELARKSHPDLGGSEIEFKAVNEAYEKVIRDIEGLEKLTGKQKPLSLPAPAVSSSELEVSQKVWVGEVGPAKSQAAIQKSLGVESRSSAVSLEETSLEAITSANKEAIAPIHPSTGPIATLEKMGGGEVIPFPKVVKSKFKLSKQALEDPVLQEEVFEKAAILAEQSGHPEIASRNLANLQKVRSGEVVPIPKHYHASTEEGIIDILKSGKIKVTQEGQFGGAFVSTVPEIKGVNAEISGGYGDYAIALSSEIEGGLTGFNSQSGRLWFSQQTAIKVGKQNVAYIIAKDESAAVKMRAVLSERGLDYKVVTIAEAESERTILTAARLQTPDAANVIAETSLPGYQKNYVPVSETPHLGNVWNKELSYEKNLQVASDSLQEGEVLIVGGQQMYVSKEGGQMFLNSVNPLTKSSQKSRVFLNRAEARNLGVDYTDAFFMENLANPTHQFGSAYRTGIIVDPVVAEQKGLAVVLAEKGAAAGEVIPFSKADAAVPVSGLESAVETAEVVELAPPSITTPEAVLEEIIGSEKIGALLDESTLVKLSLSEEYIGVGSEGIVIRATPELKAKLGISDDVIIKLRKGKPSPYFQTFEQQAATLNKLADRGVAPRVHLSSSDLLVVDEVKGIPLGKLSPLQREALRPQIQELTEVLAEEGLFIQDFHGENVFLTDSGKLMVIDVGLIETTTPAKARKLYSPAIEELISRKQDLKFTQENVYLPGKVVKMGDEFQYVTREKSLFGLLPDKVYLNRVNPITGEIEKTLVVVTDAKKAAATIPKGTVGVESIESIERADGKILDIFIDTNNAKEELANLNKIANPSAPLTTTASFKSGVIKVDSLVAGVEAYEINGIRHTYSSENGWTRSGISDLHGGEAPALDDLVLLESERLGADLRAVGERTSLETFDGIHPQVKQTIIKSYEADPLTTGHLVDAEVLSELKLGQAKFEAALETPEAEAAIASQAETMGVELEIDVTSGKLVLPQRAEYVRGEYGVVFKEENGIKTVLFVDKEGKAHFVEYAAGDTWYSGGISETTQLAQKEKLSQQVSIEEAVVGAAGVKKKKWLVKELPGRENVKPLEDLSGLERRVGYSDDVELIGDNVVHVSEPVNVPTQGGTLEVREFTVITDDGVEKVVKYPTKFIGENGVEKVILYPQEVEGKTIWASNDINSFFNQRVPSTLEEIVESGKTIHIHEGSRTDVMASLKREGFDLDTGLRYPGEAEKVGGYELWEVTNFNSGEVRYLYANLKGGSKRMHLESALRQKGMDSSKIVVHDHYTPYQQVYAQTLKTAKPDIVLIGVGDDIGAIAASKGAEVTGIKKLKVSNPELISDFRLFEMYVDGKKTTVLTTTHPNGVLSRHFTKALIDQHQVHPLKIGFSGDSGSLGSFRNQLNELNGLGLQGTELKAGDMFVPRRFVTRDGKVIEMENPIAKTLEGRTIEGTQGKVDVHLDTTHGQAFSANEEDLGYLVREVERGTDAVDVEGTFMVEAIDDARKAGQDVPETSLLFHVSDEVATGNPIATEGHFYHAKSAKHETLFEHLAGSKIDDVKFVAPPKKIPPARKIFAEYNVPDQMKREVNILARKLESEGKSYEEIKAVVNEQFGFEKTTTSIDDLVVDSFRDLELEGRPPSNTVKLAEDTSGQTFYVKETSDISARAEVVTDGFLNKLKVKDKNPIAFAETVGDQNFVATKEVIKSRQATTADLQKFKEVEEHRQRFLVDAYLGNYDGASSNNWLVVEGKVKSDGTITERLVTIDAGGALDSKPAGSLKDIVKNPDEPHKFFNRLDFTEDDLWGYHKLMTQRNSIYRVATEDDMVATANRIAKLTDDEIISVVDTFNGKITTEGALSREDLIASLILRREGVKKLFVSKGTKINYAGWVNKRKSMDKLVSKVKKKVSNGQSTVVDDILKDYQSSQREEMDGYLKELINQGKLVDDNGILKVST
jgi:hypothetical protein